MIKRDHPNISDAQLEKARHDHFQKWLKQFVSTIKIEQSVV